MGLNGQWNMFEMTPFEATTTADAAVEKFDCIPLAVQQSLLFAVHIPSVYLLVL